MLCILEGQASIMHCLYFTSLYSFSTFYFIHLVTFPVLEFCCLLFREQGDCTYEWFRVKDNSIRDRISTNGNFYIVVLSAKGYLFVMET